MEALPGLEFGNPDAAFDPRSAPIISHLKAYLRRRHRRFTLSRAIRVIRAASDPSAIVPDVFRDLTYGWNNDVWSASPEFMSGLLSCAWKTTGPILECGSGLSTLLLGVAAERTSSHVWSLEHCAFWAERVRQALAAHRIHSVTVLDASLGSYGSYSWYSVPHDTLPRNIALVVCDGPPADTPGGRYGMLPVMRSHLAPGGVILLDDATRPDEVRVLGKWHDEFGTEHVTAGASKPYARVAMPV
jgi:hypothetical protein